MDRGRGRAIGAASVDYRFPAGKRPSKDVDRLSVNKTTGLDRALHVVVAQDS